MRSLVVLSAVFAVSIAAPLESAQQPDSNIQKKRSIGHEVYTTAFYEPVVEARAVYSVPTVYAAPSAVSHQSRVDVHTSSPTVISTGPAVVAARTVVEPVSNVVSAPVQTLVSAPAAVSHQSRVDVRTSEPAVVATGPAVVTSEPAVVSTGPAVVASEPAVVSTGPAVVAARTLVAPSAYVAPATTVYSGGSAVSHQSRVDVKTSPAVITEQLVQPTYVATAPVVEAAPTLIETAPAVVDARSYYVAPATTLYSTGSAVSHQSRLDVKSSPAVFAEKLVYGPSVYTAW